MAVVARAGDVAGVVRDSSIAALTAQVAVINKSVSPLHYHAAVQALDRLQQETVLYYQANGRITAANILSTLS